MTNSAYALALAVPGTFSLISIVFTAGSIALFSKTETAAAVRALISKKLARRNPHAVQMSFAASLVAEGTNSNIAAVSFSSSASHVVKTILAAENNFS